MVRTAPGAQVVGVIGARDARRPVAQLNDVVDLQWPGVRPLSVCTAVPIALQDTLANPLPLKSAAASRRRPLRLVRTFARLAP